MLCAMSLASTDLIKNCRLAIRQLRLAPARHPQRVPPARHPAAATAPANATGTWRTVAVTVR
jgi:hypothetical protein